MVACSPTALQMTGAALRCWDVVDAHAAGRRAGSGALALRAAPTPALLEREQFAWAEGERAEALPAVALGAAAAAAAAGEEAEAAVATDDGDGDGLDAGAYAAAAALVATNRFWQHRLFSGTRFSDAVIAEALVHYGRRSGAGQAGASKAAAAAGVDDGANPFEYYERAQLEAEAWRAVRAAAERERERYDGAVAAHARAWRQLLRFCAVAWHRAHRPLGLVLPSARAGRRIAGDGATPFVAPLVVRDAGVAVLRPALPVERAALGGDDGVGGEAAHAAGGASPALRALLDVVAMLEARAAPHLLRQCDPLSASTCGIARVDEYHREGAARSDGGGDGGALYAMQTDAHDIFEDDVVLKEWVLRVAQSAAASAGAAARPSTAEHAHFAAERRAEAQARAEAVDVEDCLVAALAAGRSPFSVLEELVAFVEGEEEEVGALRLGAAGAPNATTRVWARSLWQLAAARMRAARGAALALAYIAHCASAAPLRHVLRGVEGGALLAESLALLRRCDTACWLLSRRPDEMARAYALPGCTFYLAALGTDALTPRNVARAGSAQDEFFGPHSLVRSLAESRQISTLAPLLRKLVVAAAPGGDAMKRLVRLEACCQLCLARVELSAGGAAGGTPTGRAAESFARAALLFRQGAPSAGDASLRVPEATKELQVRTSSTAVAAAGSAALAELQLIAAHVARVDAAPRADAGHSAQQWWRESSSALRSSLAGCDARLNAQLRVLASEGKGEDEDEDAVLDGDGDGDAAMAAPPRRADTRLMYYRIVMSLFSSCDQPVHALAFARCAIDATVGGGAAALMQPGQGGGHAAADGGSVVMDLWYEVFKHALTLGQKNDAFNALVQIEDTVQRKDCQSRFILELLDKRSYAWIVDFSFAHWAPHFNERRIAMISRSFDHAVETELEQQVRRVCTQRVPRRRVVDGRAETRAPVAPVDRSACARNRKAARSPASSSPSLLPQALKDFLVEPLRAKDAGSQRGRVFHVLYAWHFKRGDLRKAAEAMYHLAKHLEDDEDKYGRSASVACFVRACVERRVGALLACANAMRLLPSPRLVPYAMKGRVASGSSARDGGSRDDDDGTQLMVTLAGVEREVELALAWLAADAEAERALNGDAKDADAAATAALALELAPLFVPAESGGGACGELCEMVVPAVSGGGAAADGPSVVNVEGSLLALPPHCRTVGRAVRFIYYKKRVGGVPPSEPLRSWLCAQSNALWLDAEHAPAASTAPSSVRRLPSTQNELSKVLVTLMQLLRQEQLPEAFALARAFTPPLPAAGAELALCVTRAAARLCATAGRASVWPALRAELRAIDAATAARASADATAPTSVGGNLSAYAHYLAAAEAALAQDCDVALPQWLVDTLVWSSGHARKAAAAPSADSWASRRRPPAAALIRLFLDKGLLIEACEAATAMLQDAALSRGALSGERFAALPEALLNALLQRCREVLQRTSSHAADYRLRHLNRASLLCVAHAVSLHAAAFASLTHSPHSPSIYIPTRTGAHETLLGTFAALPA